MEKSVLAFLCLAVYIQGELVIQLRIADGTEASHLTIPYQVSILESDKHNCGGSIINSEYVLTAAHCVDQDRHYSVIAGVDDVNDLSNATVHNVVSIKIHEDYIVDLLVNDIAVIKVDPPFEFNSLIQPAKFPEPAAKFRVGQEATVSGYGYIGEYDAGKGKFLKTNVYILNQDECQKYNEHIIQNTQICSVNIHRETGFCSGDSGGPLTINGLVVGIVSVSKDCGEYYPQVYTRVSEFIAWILENIDKTPITIIGGHEGNSKN